MTDPKRPDEREPAKAGAQSRTEESRTGAAWRSLSREEPPPALDAALRAAARREVGARVQPAAVPEATRPERWWFPLAAAATIGAIAIGLLQVVTTERPGTAGGDGRTVSDMPAGARSVPAPMSKPEEPAASPAATVAPESMQRPPPEDKRAPRTTADSPSQARPAPDAATRRDAEPLAFPATAGKAEVAPAPMVLPPTAMPAPAPAPATAPVPAPASAAAPTPFAASAPSAKLGAAREQSDRAIAGSPAESAEGAVASDRARAELRQPAPSRANEMAAAGAVTGPAAGVAAPSASPPAEAQRGVELPVPEWIALIRRLRDDGKLADAERELKAFREAHPDHRTLLPPDLRDWRLPP